MKQPTEDRDLDPDKQKLEVFREPVGRGPAVRARGDDDGNELRRILVPTLVGLAGVVLVSLTRHTSIPIIGRSLMAPPLLEYVLLYAWMAFPGILVGWTSAPKRRLVPALVTLVAQLYPMGAWVFLFWSVAAALGGIFVAGVAVGVGARKLLRARRAPRTVLGVVIASVGAVVLFLWYADGWRFLYGQPKVGGEAPRLAFSDLLSMDEGTLTNRLMDFAQESLARGDVDRAKRMLPALERAGRLRTRISANRRDPDRFQFMREVVETYIRAGMTDRAVALAYEIEPDEAMGNLIFVHAYLAGGDIGKARDAAGIPAAGLIPPHIRSEAYREIAYAQAKLGRYSEAVFSVKEHVERQDQLEVLDRIVQIAVENGRPQEARGIYASAFELLRDSRDTEFRSLALMQAGRGLKEEADETASLMADPKRRAETLGEVREARVIQTQVVR